MCSEWVREGEVEVEVLVGWIISRQVAQIYGEAVAAEIKPNPQERFKGGDRLQGNWYETSEEGTVILIVWQKQTLQIGFNLAAAFVVCFAVAMMVWRSWWSFRG